MKLFLLLLSVHFFTLAADIRWSHNYKEALQDAQEQNKLIYILITSKSCQWCKKFEQTTLQDENLQTKLLKDFIPIHLVRDVDAVPSQLKTSPVPRHYFINTKGDILYEALGFRDVEVFESFLGNAKEKFMKQKGEQ